MPALNLKKTYQKYPEYKNSGVDWLGKIPLNWMSVRAKTLIDSIESGVWGNDPLENSDDILCLRVADFDFDKQTYQTVKTKRNIPGLQNRKKLRSGDILLEKSGGGENQPVGRSIIIENNDRMVCANFIEILRTNKKVIPKYYASILYAAYKSGLNLKSIHQNTGIQNLDVKSYLDEMFCLPSLEIQNKITSKLSEKTLLIDQIIDKKQKLITLLQEKRSALITHAVTKGLDPKVKMKPSGIEWVDEIPENWEIVPLFSKAKENLSKNTKLDNTNLLSLSYGKIIQKDIKSDFGLLPESFNTYQVIKNGYIVLRLTDLQNDQKSLRVGLVNDKSGIITSAYTSIIFEKVINPKYGYLLLHAYDIFKVFYGMGGGVRQSIDYKQIKKLPVLVPIKTIQNDIVNFLETKTDLVDSIVSKTEKSIVELQEFKSSLIYHAVTGKIKI